MFSSILAQYLCTRVLVYLCSSPGLYVYAKLLYSLEAVHCPDDSEAQKARSYRGMIGGFTRISPRY